MASARPRPGPSQPAAADDGAALLSSAANWVHGAGGRKTLADLAELVVPRLADFCTIDELHGGRLVRVAAAHREVERARLLRDLGAGALPEAGDAALPPALVGRTGEAALHPELPDPALAAMARDEKEVALLRGLAPTSSLAVPIRAGGDVLGVLWLGTAGSGRSLGPRELKLAEQVAAHAASFLERERLQAELERHRTGREQADADRERVLFELRQAMQVRETFLAIASHELRTPLTGLQLAVQSAAQAVSTLSGSHAGEQASSRLAIADKQVRKLCGLVDRLLDVARIELGTVELYPSDVELSRLAAEVAGRFQEDAARAGCALEVRLLRTVHGRWDPARLETVIGALLSNAIKFGAGRPVILEVGLERGLARLSVSDHGPGIAPSSQELVFERFQRASAPLHHGGLGLGLWIARRIVEACGGQLTLSSVPGDGATFTVSLPLHPSDRAVVAA